MNRPDARPDRSKAASQVALLTGGGDRPYALGLATSLIQKGVQFDFIGSDFLESPELRRSPQVRVLNLRGDMRPDVSTWKKVARVATYYARLLMYAATSEAKVFHILWNNKLEWFDRTFLMLYYRLFGKRTVLTVHNVNIRQRDGNDSFLNRLTLRVQYRLADHLFVHTQQMHQQLQRDFDVPPEKIDTIPFGINSTVPNTDLTRAEARRRCGLDPSAKVILFFGNIAPYKGLIHLVESFSQVISTIPQCRLVIAGQPKGSEEYWGSVERRIAALGIQDKLVLRIEYVPDAETEIYFKAADVLALPYTQIFQSGVLFLGYNFGLPVIASDVGSLKEDIVEGKTGIVCRPCDSDDLSRAIRAIFTNLHSPAESTLLQRDEIRQFADEKYSWTTVASMTTAVYSKLSPATNGRQARSGPVGR